MRWKRGRNEDRTLCQTGQRTLKVGARMSSGCQWVQLMSKSEIPIRSGGGVAGRRA